MPTNAVDVLDSALRALQERNWGALSEYLIDVHAACSVPASNLSEEFGDVELLDWEILDVEEVGDLRRDVTVHVERDWVGEKLSTVSITLLCLGDDSRPDRDGEWAVTNRIVLRSPGT